MKKLFLILTVLLCLSTVCSASFTITGDDGDIKVGYDPATVRHYTENSAKITEGWFIITGQIAQTLRRVKVNDNSLLYVIQESCLVRTDGRPTACHSGFLKKEEKAGDGSLFEGMLKQMINH